MQTYFIPHKLKVGDITHLSDKDSDFLILKNLHEIEDIIKVSNLEGEFSALITNIEKKSVEVEIVEKTSNIIKQNNGFSITIIQSISNDIKFNFFLEKAVELGAAKIIPIQSQYSLIPLKKALKKVNLWKKVLKEAREQSRNPFDVEISTPTNIKNLKDVSSKYKICLATEPKNSISLQKSLEKKKTDSTYTIAIGPERGWSVSDIMIFKELGFEFVKLKGNILRTETAGLVISSILNFKEGRY